MYLDVVRPKLYQMILEEAVGAPLAQLTEPGWLSASAGLDLLTGIDRQRMNEEAWRYYFTDPSTRHMVRLLGAYTFGRGVTARAKDSDVNEVISKFWNDPRNRHVLSRAQAQHNLSRDLSLNGEVFLMFFTSRLNGRVTVRTVNPSEITNISTAPGDTSMPQLFERVHVDKSGKRHADVIPDYRFANARAILGGGNSNGNTEISMMHILGNDFGGRGLSPMSVSIPWIRTLKGFMEDRAVLTFALRTFAFRQRVKGSAVALRRARDRWNTAEMNLEGKDIDGDDRRRAGRTYIENDGATFEQLNTHTGSSEATEDARLFRQQVGIGQGLFEHYLGDAGDANLATATAMELPMLKIFEFEQQFWGDIFSEIFEFIIIQALRFAALPGKADLEIDFSGASPVWLIEPRKEDTDLQVDVMFPPIVQRDTAIWSTALSQIKQSEVVSGQQMIPPEQSAEIALRLFGFTTRAPEIIEEMRDNDFALPEQEEDEPEPQPVPPQFQQQQPPPPPNGVNGSEPATDEDIAAALREAVKRIKERAIGQPLPKKQAEEVKPITRKEVDAAFDAWAELPSLEALAKELGVTVEELDED